MNAHILIVDDEKNIREGIGIALKRNGHTIFFAEDGLVALEVLAENDIDLVITDLKMPNIDGEALLYKVIELYTSIPVIILTGHGTVERAVKAMRDGAYDFLTKPLNLEKLSLIVNRALSQRQLQIENRNLQYKLSLFFGSIIGKSERMNSVLNVVEKVAPTKTSVLILGENGVGKELVANMVKDLSTRADKPFIKVHCSALSESLLESELFGHEKGAFTGAIKAKKGRFELADGGTVFLDEIGEISHTIQVKLLRVLQEKTFERVGGETTLKVDVRIISATNKDLKKEIEEGRFREDLYYRLNVVQIVVPPLRERPEDIPLLISHFLIELSKENNKVINEISQKAKNALYNYDWPGNVRELRNVIESSIVLSKSNSIDINDLPKHIRLHDEKDEDLVLKMPLSISEIEKQAIIHTLQLCKGNKSKAAELLQMNRKTLYTKINDFMILNEGQQE